jgi:hypothetical protein
MKPVAKAGVVLAGYIAAFLVASLVLKVYIAATDTPDRVSSGGMWAFGDGMLFLGVLALAAVPATGAALFWLRASTAFWARLSVAALVIAATSMAAFVIYATQARSGPTSPMNMLPAYAVLRLLVAPLFAGFFCLAGLFAPYRTARLRLFAAGALELLSIGLIAMTWIRSPH